MAKTRLLLVDDHKMVRDGFRRTLEDDETLEIVGEAGDGLEAIEKLEELKPELIIMDINMPRLNGIDATKEIRKTNQDVKIIILTMLDDERFIFESLSAGINGYLFKEAEIDELFKAIRMILKGENYFNEEVTNKIIDFHSSKNMQKAQEQHKTVPLSKREIEILKLISKGYESQEIADTLFISYFTVLKHRKNIIKKLNLRNINEVLSYSIEKGII